MTVYLNEFNPNDKNDLTRGVQADPKKLKFNNIQSCIAVAIHQQAPMPQLVGVHFTTHSAEHPSELEDAFGRMKALMGKNAVCQAVLVGPYTAKYKASRLMKEVKKLTSSIAIADIPMIDGAADVDVKVELSAGLRVYVRRAIKNLKSSAGGVIETDKFAALSSAARMAHMKAGKRSYKTDRDDKPWSLIPVIMI